MLIYIELHPFKMSTILITGGTGLIGQHLAKLLTGKGHKVALVSRSSHHSEFKTYVWNPEKKEFPIEALNDTEIIVHLAGAGIADQYWTKSYKEKILKSRTESAQLLFETLKNNKHKVHTFVASSAIGYYGDSGDVWVDESRPAADDFLGNTCKTWERSSSQFESLGIRVAIMRIGIVLAKESGALPPIMKAIKLFAGAPFGDGKQYMSWIHIDDLCRQFQFAIENTKVRGVYNAVAPSPVQNAFFTKTLGKILHRPIWPINVPAFLMKIILGEKAVIVLNGQRVTNEKIRLAGFTFKFNDVRVALEDLLLK